MLNFRKISSIIGKTLLIEGGLMLVCTITSLLYNELDLMPLLISSVITILLASSLILISKKTPDKFLNLETFFTASIIIPLMSIVGFLPYYISDILPDFSNALFESVSGFTTTGATTIDSIESVPHGILLWRSMTQWIGGIGIILMGIILFSLLGTNGSHPFYLDVSGQVNCKINSTLQESLVRLTLLYLTITGLASILLALAGMSLFDAINHAMTTVSAGGFSTKANGILFFNSALIEYIIIVFMIIAGINFSLLYIGLRFNIKKLLNNFELKHYLLTILGFTILILLLIFTHTTNREIGSTIRRTFFQVVSNISTTGFYTLDAYSFPRIILLFFLATMVIGGSMGSISSGIKGLRFLLLFKNGILEFKRIIHPNAIIPVRLDNNVVLPKTILNILIFFTLFILTFVMSVVVMTFFGMDVNSAIGAVTACLTNLATGIGSVGPGKTFAHVSDAGKIYLSFIMVLGRIELFTMFVILFPSSWRRF